MGELGFKLILLSFDHVNLFFTPLTCVLRGFWGNEVRAGRTHDAGGAGELGRQREEAHVTWMDGFKIINLIREGVAIAELQCVINISTLPFVECHLFQSSPVFSPVNNVHSCLAIL